MTDQQEFNPKNLDLNEIAQRAAKIQEKMQKAHNEVSSIEVTGESGGGLAKATVNGRHAVINLTVDQDTWEKEDKTFILDIVTAAINDANSKVDEAARKKMLDLSEEMGFGGEQQD